MLIRPSALCPAEISGQMFIVGRGNLFQTQLAGWAFEGGGVTGRQANGQFKGVESDSGFPGSTLEASTTACTLVVPVQSLDKEGGDSGNNM